MSVSRFAVPRKVSGRPASAAQPSAAVMPGTTMTGTSCGAQIVKLLAAAAEHEGIAALEAHDVEAAAGGIAQAAVDLVLADARCAAALADEHAFGVAPRAIENPGRDELVVENDVGALQRVQGPQRQKSGSPGPAPTRCTVPTGSFLARGPRSRG